MSILQGVAAWLFGQLARVCSNTQSNPRRAVRPSVRQGCGVRVQHGSESLLIVLVAGLALTSCADEGVVIPATVDYPPIVLPHLEISTDVLEQRGSIVTRTELTDLDPSLSNIQRGWRATYHSVSGVTGERTEVSGAFFVPTGQPPEGGWSVIAVGHGTTGAGNGCGVSSEPNLRGYANAVAGFLKSGHAVAVTDYEGLGDAGSHPFLEPRTAAFNLIDSVRALRALTPDISSSWLAYGASQGGQAAWAADELDKVYGDGLKLVGAVALAPAANIVGLSELAYRQQLTPEQLPLTPMVIAGLARYDPAIVPSQYLRGTTLKNLEELIGCGPNAENARGSIPKEDVGPTTQASADVLTQALRRIALPQAPLGAPLLVINGLRDLTVLPPWTAAAVMRSCALHRGIEQTTMPQDGHDDLFSDGAVLQLASDWTADRFARIPALPTCA